MRFLASEPIFILLGFGGPHLRMCQAHVKDSEVTDWLTMMPVMPGGDISGVDKLESLKYCQHSAMN